MINEFTWAFSLHLHMQCVLGFILGLSAGPSLGLWPSPSSALEPIGPSSCHRYWGQIKRIYKKLCGNTQVAPSLSEFAPNTPHTGHLQTLSILVRKSSHKLIAPLTHIVSHSEYIWSPCIIATRKLISTQSSVLISQRKHLGTHACITTLESSSSVQAWFSSAEWVLICISSYIIESSAIEHFRKDSL
jgi:hypothetical protein